MKILCPVDGSENSLRALRYVLTLREELRSPPEIHLLNVQAPVMSGTVKLFINDEQLRQYYHDEAALALRPARELLETAGIAYRHHILVGDVAATIVRFAREQACAQIVMGTRGLGAVSSAIVGSVTNKLLQLGEVPVTIVR
jgi:nucleotide-binding universal stress UspA family protein